MSTRFSNKNLCIRLWFHETGDTVTRVFYSIVLVMEPESSAERKAKGPV
jgi:hypothetical protein